MNLFTKSLILFVITIFISGCSYTTNEYISPSGVGGNTCITSCQISKNKCYKNQFNYNNELTRSYNRDLEVYNHCLKYNGQNNNKYGKFDSKTFVNNCLKHGHSLSFCQRELKVKHKFPPKHVKKCFKPMKYVKKDFNCSLNYDTCFLQCGGIIKPVEKELF